MQILTISVIEWLVMDGLKTGYKYNEDDTCIQYQKYQDGLIFRYKLSSLFSQNDITELAGLLFAVYTSYFKESNN